MSTISAIEPQSSTLSIEPFLPPDLPARHAVVRTLEAVLGIDCLRESYRRLPPAQDAQTFARRALDMLNVSMEVASDDLARIPHPEHRLLSGPVSIGNDYHPISQRILVQFLARHYLAAAQTAEVKPRQPLKQWRRPEAVLDALADPESPLLDDILRELEADGKGMPVLLRQYLKLGGKILGFNVDPAFNRVIDCLLLVDLDATGEEALGKYMGRAEARRYFARAASDLRAA